MAERLVEVDDGVLRTWAHGDTRPGQPPLVLLHGGPGLPDYLLPVAEAVSGVSRVHRYDQRGTGGSPWRGQHTIARHVRDLELLLDAWGCERAVIVGHSFGADLAASFTLAHPERVAGVVFLCGPFVDLPEAVEQVGPWRGAAREVERSRLTAHEQARLEELEALAERSNTEDVEWLTLKWATDHADPVRATAWAREAAHARRPVNTVMNAQLNADKRRDPLESRIDDLRRVLPEATTIIGGGADPRPAVHLRLLGGRLGCEVVLLPEAGHEPWLEQPERFRSALRRAVGVASNGRH